MKQPVVTIIGPGRVGNALAKALEKSGYKIGKVYSRGDDYFELNDLIFITTPDSEIRQVASQIVQLNENLKGKIFIHCSGAISSTALNYLKERGASIGCFHPLQSVSQETDSFENIYFDLEGDEQVLVLLEDIASALGARSFRVTPQEKELLHVSAVMASNYLVTLSDLALRISESTKISQRELLNALIPLMGSSLKNLEELSPTGALTGPIARGDIQTVQKHIKLLEKKPELLEIYKKLGLLTLELIGNDLRDNTIKFRLYDTLK